MANVLVNENSLSDIADAIRSKKGVSTTYKPSEMADAISSISGGITPSGTKTINITQNGTVTEDVTNYTNAQVNVNVSNPSTGTKSITSNGTHDVTDYASAQVNVPNSYTQSDEGKVVVNGSLASQTSQSITVNGTYDTTVKNAVMVDVPSITKVEGEFTIANDNASNFPTITHNLHTQKIGVIAYPKTAISFPDAYRAYYFEFINTNALCDGETWTLDYSAYSTALTSAVNVSVPNSEITLGTGHTSPTKAVTNWAQTNAAYNVIKSGQVTITDDTFKYNGGSYATRWGQGTYHYIVWKLG